MSGSGPVNTSFGLVVTLLDMKTLRKLFICLVLSAIVVGVPGVAAAQGRWWQSDRFQKELALTQEQITRIEGVYQSTLPLLRAQKEAFDRRDEKLSKVIADPKSDEAVWSKPLTDSMACATKWTVPAR